MTRSHVTLPMALLRWHCYDASPSPLALRVMSHDVAIANGTASHVTWRRHRQWHCESCDMWTSRSSGIGDGDAFPNDVSHTAMSHTWLIASHMNEFVSCVDESPLKRAMQLHTRCSSGTGMGWLRLVGSIQLYVSFAKEPYNRDNILQKRPITLSMLVTKGSP